MEVCYAYDGIGRVIMEMTASDWAAWGSTVGTLAAVWAAFWLYKRQTNDTNREKAARRRVLHGMLEAYVRGAAERPNDQVRSRWSSFLPAQTISNILPEDCTS